MSTEPCLEGWDSRGNESLAVDLERVDFVVGFGALKKCVDLVGGLGFGRWFWWVELVGSGGFCGLFWWVVLVG